MAYSLRVKFKSNEAPWSGGYEPNSWHQPKDDEAAIEWAVGMSEGLGLDYIVTLTKDGVVIPLPIRPICLNCGVDTSFQDHAEGCSARGPLCFFPDGPNGDP